MSTNRKGITNIKLWHFHTAVKMKYIKSMYLKNLMLVENSSLQNKTYTVII